MHKFLRTMAEAIPYAVLPLAGIFVSWLVTLGGFNLIRVMNMDVTVFLYSMYIFGLIFTFAIKASVDE